MVDPWDDMALAKRPFKVVACIPVFGRRPLLAHTIRRLYLKNDVYKVICAGHDNADRKVCESAGAVWVQHRNYPLGAKWNAAFMEARKYNPDACLFVGSSDWISDNWTRELEPLMNEYDLVGTLGCHFLDIGDDFRLVFWPGYHKIRIGESIGIGRLISNRLLNKMQWKPFNDQLDKSLDGSMQITCTSHAGRIHVVNNPNINSLSISTDQWDNKHKFDHHWDEENPRYLPSIKLNPEPFLSNHFPEAYQIFKTNEKEHIRTNGSRNPV